MITIDQHVWGMTPEGEAIILYTMRNAQGAEVRVTNFGAAVVSATMPDREGRMADVVLGYKHPEGYFFDGGRQWAKASDAAPTASRWAA